MCTCNPVITRTADGHGGRLWDRVGPRGTAWDHMGPRGTMRDPWDQLIKVISTYGKFISTYGKRLAARGTMWDQWDHP